MLTSAAEKRKKGLHLPSSPDAWLRHHARASFSSIAFVTKSITDVSALTQCNFSFRCSDFGMRVANWIHASVVSRAMAPGSHGGPTRGERCGPAACSFATTRYTGIGRTRRPDAEGESQEARRVQRAHLSALREEDARAGPLRA